MIVTPLIIGILIVLVTMLVLLVIVAEVMTATKNNPVTVIRWNTVTEKVRNFYGNLVSTRMLESEG